MRQLRAIAIVILGIGIFVSGIPAVGPAVAQEAPAGGKRATPEARSPAGRDFDTDWHQAPGRPSVLEGCVYNLYGAHAHQVGVGVEGLDAKGAVVGSTNVWLPDVPARSYAHFEVPVLAGAASYRIKVLAYEWTQGR